MAVKNYTLSPSDFAFLWEECKRCFYLKIVEGFKRPGGPFPRIFGVIDSEMRNHFMDGGTARMTPDLPPGKVVYGEKWVQSVPIALDGHHITCTIRGKFDTVVQFEDGSYGVIDFKTSAIKPTQKRLYSRQLRAYAYALEHPAPGKLGLSPISRMGLLAFTPDTFTTQDARSATLSGGLHWYEIKRNDDSFFAFLDEVMSVLELPEPPDPDPNCQWCQYREQSRQNGL